MSCNCMTYFSCAPRSKNASAFLNFTDSKALYSQKVKNCLYKINEKLLKNRKKCAPSPHIYWKVMVISIDNDRKIHKLNTKLLNLEQIISFYMKKL